MWSGGGNAAGAVEKERRKRLEAKGNAMATYVTLINFTDQGIRQRQGHRQSSEPLQGTRRKTWLHTQGELLDTRAIRRRLDRRRAGRGLHDRAGDERREARLHSHADPARLFCGGARPDHGTKSFRRSGARIADAAERARIDERTRAAEQAPDFSRLIRVGVPAPDGKPLM